MAKMIPLELREGEFLSFGEKEIFESLKEGLSDEWIVIYSLRWITDDDIYLTKSNGESDFVIINPNYGIIILEVKGGVISCINGEWSSISTDNTKRAIKDPEKQANTFKYSLLSRFRKSNVNPYITTAVWFPDCLKEKCILPLSMPKEIVLDMLSFNNIEQNLLNIFKYRANKEGFSINKLSESEFKKIMDILNPKTEIKMPLLRLTNKLNMKYAKLNDEQNTFFEQLDDNKNISVNGHAGTGKTLLAVKKAFREYEAGKSVLFLCYNSLLKDKISEESNGQFKVHSIHSFAIDYLKQYNTAAYNAFEQCGDFELMMEEFLKELELNRTKNKLYYDVIIIDEGQDFKEAWFKGISKVLKLEGSSCVFYDENQMLYAKYGRVNIDFLDKGTKFTLKRNMRNTDEICLSSLSVINVDKDNVKLNGVPGIKPDLIFSDDAFDTVNHLKAVIRELKKDQYLSDDNISVLTVEAKKKLKIKNSIIDEFRGTVESIRRFKGLESDVVIIPDLNSTFMDDEEIRKLLYVGMSRAKAHVILIIDIENFNRKQKNSYKKDINMLFLGEDK